MIKILEVEIIPGKTFRSNWRNPMQRVTTDKGVFIDNVPKAVFNDVSETGKKWIPGVTYATGDYEIYSSGGFRWINKARG